MNYSQNIRELLITSTPSLVSAVAFLCLTFLFGQRVECALQDAVSIDEFLLTIRTSLEKFDNFTVDAETKASSIPYDGSLSVVAEYSVTVDRFKVLIDGSEADVTEFYPFRIFLDGHSAYRLLFGQATVDSYDNAAYSYSDPRVMILGVSNVDSFEEVFRYLNNYSELVSISNESIDEIPLKKFVWARPDEDRGENLEDFISFWIDNSNRVHLFENQFARGQVNRTKSTYDSTFGEGRIPKIIKHESWRSKRDEGDGKSSPYIRSVRIESFSNFRSGASLPENGWAALKLDVGTPAVDIRKSERVGYWSADNTLSEFPTNLKQSKSVEPAHSKPGNRQGVGFWIFVSIGVTTLALALLLWYRGRDQKS